MSKRSEAREIAFKTIYGKFFNIDEENLEPNLPSESELTNKIKTPWNYPRGFFVYFSLLKTGMPCLFLTT